MGVIIPARQIINKAVKSIVDYQTGKKFPIKTGIEWLDYWWLGGMIPPGIYTIAGRSGTGKTFFTQRIEENIFNESINPGCNNTILVRCNFEMSAEQLLVRRLSRELDEDIDEILFNPLVDEERKQKFKEVTDKERDDRIYYYPIPTSADEFYEDMKKFISGFPPHITVIMEVDHIALFRATYKESKKESIDHALVNCKQLTREFDNLIIVLLSQLNRNIAERRRPADAAPLPTDLFQTDELAQIADYVMCIHRPEHLNLNKYMSFPIEAYPDLNKYKDQSGKSFRTMGLIYYHSLKLRQTRIKKAVVPFAIEIIPGYEKYYDGSGVYIREENDQHEETMPTVNETQQQAFTPPPMASNIGETFQFGEGEMPF